MKRETLPKLDACNYGLAENHSERLLKGPENAVALLNESNEMHIRADFMS
jgi:hypothetical protein